MRRTPLRRVSRKREAERPDRERVRQNVLRRDRYTCQGKDVVPEVECRGGLDVDEIAPRGVYPGGHLVESNCHSLCRGHHDWKHDNPVEAEKRGLRKWSWDR